ncbi:MAG TPA: PIN domain-containing protein [Candidatus Sulfotelmatobacter sp.]|nr:PIN domain-containing protein [Candidatus Sulfotelmatobacter sp.]
MDLHKPVIVDTSAFFALYSIDDALHNKAKNIAKLLFQNNRRTILLGDVFTELLNIVGKKLGKKTQEELGNNILTSSAFDIVEADIALRELAIQKLKQISVSLSYTDCLVMVLADTYETKEIFGFDDIFRKKGYLLPQH